VATGHALARRDRTPRPRGLSGISRPERLAFTYAWEDETGHPKHETLVTLTFADLGDGQTELTLHQARFASAAARDDHEVGWASCLKRFADFLAARVT
jgi:uncharacterized protein YndB with AHSA1/START domain